MLSLSLAKLPNLPLVSIKAAPALPLARRQRRPPAFGEAPAAARRATPAEVRRSRWLSWQADPWQHGRLPRHNSVQLAATASMALPAVASHAIGSADH